MPLCSSDFEFDTLIRIVARHRAEDRALEESSEEAC